MAEGAPTGTVTFLFSDIEGSTRHWEHRHDAMRLALRRHDDLVRGAVLKAGGTVFKTVGDEFCTVFSTAPQAVEAALAGQRAIGAEDWREIGTLRVRMAIHTGFTDERDGDYYGPTVNRVARLLATAHGGQVVVSRVAADLAHAAMPAQTSLRDLGEHRLKDLTEPERVYQLVAPGLEADFPALRSLEAVQHNLPLQVSSFVGRSAEVAEIVALLGRSRLVTLVGAGGIGKTRASLEAAATVVEAHPAGVWFVEFGALRDPDLVATAITAAVKLNVPPTEQPLETLTAYLRTADALLILDNCEHLVSAVARVVDAVLHVCPSVSVLATSRESLELAGEAVYRMPSLRVPPDGETVTAAEAQEYGAVALFAERATSVSAFRLTDANVETVVQISRRLDGMPLAIELAATRMKIFRIDELAKRLDDRFHVLTGGARTALPRQQTLHATIDWSHELLSEDEKLLFRRLAIFAGGWTLEAMARVCTDERLAEWDAVDLLQSLVEKSLVVADVGDDRQRYGFLESTRLYAHEKLDDAGETKAMQHAHAHYFLAMIRRAADDLGVLPSRTWHAIYQPELENCRVALEQHGAGDALTYRERAADLALMQSAQADAVSHLQSALDLLAAHPASSERDQRELALRLKLGPALILTCGFGSIEENYRRAFEVAQALGDGRGGFVALWGLWRASLDRAGGGKQQRELGLRLVNLADELADDQLRLNALHARWMNLWRAGTPEATLADAREGLRLYDPERHYAQALMVAGHDPAVCANGQSAIAHAFMGKFNASGDSAAAAIALARAIGHPFIVGFALTLAAVAYHVADDVERCERTTAELMRVTAQSGDPTGSAVGAVLAGWCMAVHGDATDGFAQAKRGVEKLVRLNRGIYIPFGCATLASIALALDDLPAVRAFVREGEAWYADDPNAIYRPELDRLRAMAALRDVSSDEDVPEQLLSAFTQATEQRSSVIALRVAMALAAMQIAGEPATASRERLTTVLATIDEDARAPLVIEARDLVARFAAASP